jgi:hypothetical protein
VSEALFEADDVAEACVGAAMETWGAELAKDDVVADAAGILNPMTAAMNTIDTKKRKNVSIGVNLRLGFMILPVKLLNLWDFLDLGDNADLSSASCRC